MCKRNAISWYTLRTKLHAFKNMILADTILVVPGAIILAMSHYFLFPVDLLAVSPNTSWGVITSLFVHEGPFHFGQNVVGLLLLTFLLAFTSIGLSEKGRRDLSFFFLWNVFFSAIMANSIYLVLMFVIPLPKSIGSSGAVYASWGIMMGYVTLHSIPPSFKKDELVKYLSDKKNRSIMLSNLTAFIVFLIFILVNQRAFLSVEPGVNVFVHFAGFFIGYLSVGLCKLVRDVRGDEKKLIVCCQSHIGSIMPEKSTSEDLLTRDSWLMYYIWKQGSYKDSISALSEQLGYKDDSDVNRKINKLKNTGYLKEVKNGLKLTKKGKIRLLPLILSDLSFTLILILGLPDIIYGIDWIIYKIPIMPEAILAVGLIHVGIFSYLLWEHRTVEKQLWKVDKTPLQQ